MQATKILPSDYHHLRTLDLSSARVILWLNLAAIPLFFLFGMLFERVIILLRSFNPLPGGILEFFIAISGWELLALPLSILIMIVFHELVHGFFFWQFTREQPRFAVRLGYAYAAAPEWYLPGSQYIVVGLSPFIIISVISIFFAAFVPSSLVPYLLLIATFNAAGSLGDLVVVGWVLKQPKIILVKDEGDIFSTYAPNRD